MIRLPRDIVARQSTNRRLSQPRMFVPTCAPSSRACRNRCRIRDRARRWCPRSREDSFRGNANRPGRSCRRGPRRWQHAAVDGCRRQSGSGTPDRRWRPSGRSSPSFRRFEYSSIFAVTQFPPGHRAGTSARRSCRQMSMKCQGAVDLSSSRNSLSGRIRAASIAVAIAHLSADTPRMFATWLAAAGVRLSAAMTATILCPSGPHAHADTGQSRSAKTRFAIRTRRVNASRKL